MRAGFIGPLLTGSMGLVLVACRDPSPPPAKGTTTSTTITAPGSAGSQGTTPPVTTGPSPTSSADGGSTSASGPTAGSGQCTRNVVLMGYWPPTNEMLRPWSTNPQQNPAGWQGHDWGGYGYDVYSFFPEFPPDGDPSNDSIGDDGAVGSPRFDLRVDYQATSADFWRLVDTYRPVILLTTSRGGAIGWEVEAIEGGHGVGNGGDPALDWSSDQHGPTTHPTQRTIEPRSWDVISTYRQGNTLPTQLPVDAIVRATTALGVATVEVDRSGTSGNFLSGFLGLHGLAYNARSAHNIAAGHIHVGNGMPVAVASPLIEQTLHAVLQQHPAEGTPCSEPGE